MTAVTCPHCGSWSAGPWEWRGRRSSTCPECSQADEWVELVQEVGVPVRNANFFGLGDRRGLAIEKVDSRRDQHDLPITEYVAYLDGVEIFRRPTWEAAYRDGAQRARGRMGQ